MELIETSIFTRQITALLSDEEYGGFQSRIAADTELGALIRGGGGIRKVRVAVGSRGKSGGARVVYYWAVRKDVILLLYGSEFLPSVRPLWILLPGIVSLSVYKVLGNEIAGRGKPVINSIALGVSLVVNFFLNWLLIPRWGISGAAFASTVSYTVTAVMTLVVFTKMSGNSWFDTIVVKGEDLKIYMKLATDAKSGILAAMRRSHR